MNDLSEKYVKEGEAMEVNPNLAFLVNEWDKWRLLALQGSTRSGKTFSIVHFVIYIIETYTGLTISIVRETLPSLKATILRDFKEEMLRMNLWSDSAFNKTELEYRHNGNLIEFFSIDDEQKVRGRKRQILIGNEANEIPKDRWLQLMLRTEGIAIIDYNPSMTESHIYDLLERDDCAMIVTTYKNNPFLSPEIVSEIERLKETDENLWKVYGCGIRGEDRAGVIYPRWVKTDKIPIDLPNWYGLDFGFSCFSGETLIETNRGSVLIKDIQSGDMVLTRSGYKRVLKVLNKGYQPVVEKEIGLGFENKRFICTFNHNFNANGKWKKYGELTKRDNLFVLSHLKERYIRDTQKANTPITTITNTKKRVFIILNYYITQFLSKLTETYQRARLSTILTGTLLITTLQIWLLSLLLNTLKYTTILAILIRSIWQKYEANTDIGAIIGNKEERGLSKTLKMRLEVANIAVMSLLQQIRTKGSALLNATINGNILQRKIILRLNAKYAERNLCKTNILNKKLVAPFVQINSQSIQEIKTIRQNFTREVYDLQIEDKHEYFANGILVHNCDPTGLVRITYDSKNRTIWIKEVAYQKELSNSDIARLIKQDIKEKETQIYKDENLDIRTKDSLIWVNDKSLGLDDYINDTSKLKSILDTTDSLYAHISKELKRITNYLFEVYCDSAEPKSIAELRNYGISAYPCIKGAGSIASQIFFLYNFRILYQGENIDNERKKYKWKEKKGKDDFDNVPIDAFNHILDGARYGIFTHLTRIGM